MRINEAYEHAAIIPCPGDETGNCNCNKIVTQCVDVTAPVTLIPTASLGTVTVSCQGVPVVNCVPDPCGTSSTITVTQRVCVTIPVREHEHRRPHHLLRGHADRDPLRLQGLI